MFVLDGFKTQDPFRYAKCRKHPINEADCFLTGSKKSKHYYHFCSTTRSNFSKCKEAGLLWEPKNSVVRSLSNVSLMDEVRRRGLLNLMKAYKQEKND